VNLLKTGMRRRERERGVEGEEGEEGEEGAHAVVSLLHEMSIVDLHLNIVTDVQDMAPRSQPSAAHLRWVILPEGRGRRTSVSQMKGN